MDCCSQGSCQSITYESQVTLQSQMASTRLTTIQYAWSGTCCSRCVPQEVQVGDKPSFKRNLWISACCHYLLKSWPSQRWISIGMQSAKSKTAWKLSTLLHIGKTCKSILVIPHGNADTERLFSHIGLIKTKFRNRLGIS